MAININKARMKSLILAELDQVKVIMIWIHPGQLSLSCKYFY